jgi:chaperone required for assembly of F1-ATPase
MQGSPKRFYKRVAVSSRDGAHEVNLDGRALRSPARADLHFPTLVLAEAVAEEWARQGERIDAANMPLMTLSSTAVDHIGPRRESAIEELVGFGEHDLLCYWSEESGELAQRQQESWQPLLTWASLTLDAPLQVVRGIMPESQPAESIAVLRGQVSAQEVFPLMALLSASQAAGSLIIGLAMVKGRLTAIEAFEAALLDETYQMERWGKDHEALARHETLRGDLEQAARLLSLLKS